jgi:hypothetical protein
MNTTLTNLCGRVVLPALFMTCACTINEGERVATSAVRTESRSVALGAAKRVKVSLEMKAGELKITGGAQPLLDADFTYNVPRWKPEVKYEVNGDVGNLELKQPESGGALGNTRYEWDLRLNNKVPMQITADMGAGRATLMLGGLSLSKLELNMGAGETTVDLTGNWKNDFSGQINGGVGRATLRLPRDVGVRVVAEGGLGAINAHGLHKQGDAYVNDEYGKSPVTLNLEVAGGVGEINLELGEEPPAA